MNYNLTDTQKDVLRWIVRRVRDGSMPEEFWVTWTNVGPVISGTAGRKDAAPKLGRGELEVLAAADMLLPCERHETDDRYVLRRKAYDAVDSDFAAPDTSFFTHLTPLADVTNLDEELKTRCLPILSAGAANPRMWDSAVRTAVVVLEERLHDVGRISDPSRLGVNLVNDIFRKRGSLAGEFSQDAERQGYRDLYAGMFGAVRNRYGHRSIDPQPKDGGAIIVFVNLLLKMLEDLR